MQLLQKSHLVYFFYIVTIVALIFSPFLLSVGMIGLCTLCLFNWTWVEGLPRLYLERKTFRRWARPDLYPQFWALTLLFLLVLLSFWQTEHWDYWQERLRIKLPFLGLPLAFLGHQRLERRALYGLLFIFILLLGATALAVGANYLLHYEEIQAMLKQGQSIPVPRNHIRFSLLLAFGVLCSGYLFQAGYYYRRRWERWLILGLFVGLFAFLHLLAVRSGLLAAYVAFIVLALRYVLVSRRWKLGVALLVLLLSLPVIAYWTIPSFQTKIRYMHWDWLQYRQGIGGDYADSGRIVSLEVGWEIFRQNPLFGVGAGNLRQASADLFRERYPDFDNPLTPHNQYLYTAAATGVFGLGLFLIGFLYPLFYRRAYRQPLLLGFYAMVLTAFAIEHTIENSMGAGYVSFFLVLLLRHLNDD